MNNLSNPEINHEEISQMESAEKFLTDAGIINEGSLEQEGVTSGDYMNNAAIVTDSTGGKYVYVEVKTQKSGYDWETANYLVDLPNSRYMHLGGRDTSDNDYGVFIDPESKKLFKQLPFSEGDPSGKVYEQEVTVDEIISDGNWQTVQG